MLVSTMHNLEGGHLPGRLFIRAFTLACRCAPPPKEWYEQPMVMPGTECQQHDPEAVARLHLAAACQSRCPNLKKSMPIQWCALIQWRTISIVCHFNGVPERLQHPTPCQTFSSEAAGAIP